MVRSTVQPKTTRLCSSIRVISLWMISSNSFCRTQPYKKDYTESEANSRRCFSGENGCPLRLFSRKLIQTVRASKQYHMSFLSKWCYLIFLYTVLDLSVVSWTSTLKDTGLNLLETFKTTIFVTFPIITWYQYRISLLLVHCTAYSVHHRLISKDRPTSLCLWRPFFLGCGIDHEHMKGRERGMGW